MAAKLIEFYDNVQAEADAQMCKSLREHPEEWVEFAPNGTSRQMKTPINAEPSFIARPNESIVSPTAQGSAPTPYTQAMPQYATQPAAQEPPTPQQPMAQVPPNPQQPMAQVPPTPQQPMPQVPPTPQQPMPQVPPNSQQPMAQVPPNPQQPMPQVPSTPQQPTAAPTQIPSAAPVIARDQLYKALQLFASSSQANSIKVRQLLASYGVESFDALPDSACAAFANNMRAWGCAV